MTLKANNLQMFFQDILNKHALLMKKIFQSKPKLFHGIKALRTYNEDKFA